MRYVLLYISLVFICGFSGVSYKSFTHDPYTKINVLILDPNRVSLGVVRAQDIGYGLDTVSDLALRYSAVAGVNGGFFRINQPISTVGLPAGVLKINNNWHGIAYKPRGALGWDPATNTILFDIIETDSNVRIGTHEFPVHVFNRMAGGNRGSLLSDSYIDHVKLTENTGILLSDNKVTDIFNNGTILIPRGAYIYNTSGTLQQRVQQIVVGDPVTLQINAVPLLDRMSENVWQKIPNIIGGGPLLIKNSLIINDYKREQLSAEFVNERHARTAVGRMANGEIILVVVEKSILNDDSGMTLQELAQFMATYGCVDALNLDGGGSSSMYINDEVVTKRGISLPERPVADALLVFVKPQ